MLASFDPLLVFTGPFQGTKVGSAGRAVVVSRSPLTDVYIDTYVGGPWPRLREAGWDGVFFTGASDAWCAPKSPTLMRACALSRTRGRDHMGL